VPSKPPVLAALLLLASTPARAELNNASSGEFEDSPDPGAERPVSHRHDGFYLRTAGGLGRTSFAATGPSGRTDLHGSTDGMLLVGGTPSPGLVIGGGVREISASGRFQGGRYDGAVAQAFEWTLGPFVDWYPDPARGLHIGALVGGSATLVSSTTTQSSVAFGATVFGGCDWWIGPQWSLGILAEASGATPSSLVDNHQNGTGYRVAPLSLGIDITLAFH
jgi:hypothetical protein